MSNPWIRGNPTVWPAGPSQTPDNVTSLPNGQARGMGSLSAAGLGLTAPLGDLILPPWLITTGTGAIAGTISRYIILSEDNSLWTGGINPTVASDQSALLNAMLAYDSSQAAFLDAVTVSAASTPYYFRWRSLQQLLGNAPRYVSILIYNQSGQALNNVPANHTVQYASESYA